MATIEDFLIENIGSKFGKAIGTGQAGTFNPEIAKILANITQPSQPNQGDTLEDFALPPASGLFGRPISFNSTSFTPSSSGISAGGIAGPAIAGTLSAIIDALFKGQQPGGQKPGEEAVDTITGVAGNTQEFLAGIPIGTGLGEGEDVPVGVQPNDETAGTGLTLDPSIFQLQLDENIGLGESGGLPSGIGAIPSAAISNIGTSLGEAAGGAIGGAAGSAGGLLSGLGPIASTIGSGIGGLITQSLFGGGINTGTTEGVVKLALSFAGPFGIFAAPLIEAIGVGRGEREDIAEDFKTALTPLFKGAGLGEIDLGQVGGQGRKADPHQALTGDLARFDGAAKAISAFIVPTGQAARRAPIIENLIDNNLVSKGANEQQTLALLKSLLPQSFDELVNTLPKNKTQLMGGFSGHDDVVATRILQDKLRRALTGAAEVYVATGRLGTVPTAQIDAAVSTARWSVNAEQARRDQAKEDVRLFNRHVDREIFSGEDDREETRRLGSKVSARVRERAQDRRDDARDDT